MSGQCALVTGATGFIGRHLVDRLIDAKTQVVALIRPGSLVPEQWRGRVTCIECADWSEAGLRAALASQSFDVVFHLATYGVRPDRSRPLPDAANQCRSSGPFRASLQGARGRDW